MFTRAPFRGPIKSTLASSLAAILCTGGMNAVYGQESDEDSQASNQTDEVIIVTGSRIRRSEYDATNATVSVSASEMSALGITSAADMVAQLPQNVGTNTPETNTDTNYFLGATIANLRGMNTFYGTRTLTMIDSRRIPATNNGGGVDLNLIPNALISRVETVTGGASATYGADAMAGVVNVILDRNINENRINLSYETTSEGDGERLDFSFGTGFELFEGRGSMQIGIDHIDQDGVHDCLVRDFCRDSRAYMTNGAFGNPFASPTPYSVRTSDVADPTQAQYIIADNMRYTMPVTGIIFNDPPYYTFNEAGNDIIEIYADLTPEQLSFLDSNGENGDTPWGIGPPTYAGVPLIPETTSDNLYTRFAYELESGIEIDTEISYGESDSFSRQSTVRRTRDIAGVEIQDDNAYLLLSSPEMQAVMTAPDNEGPFGCGFLAPWTEGNAPGLTTPTCYYFDRYYYGTVEERNNTTTDTSRWSVGANGDLIEGGTWTWDTYYSWGESDTRQEIDGWPSLNRRAMGNDAVLDLQGNPVCRVLYDDPDDPDDTGDRIRRQWLYYFDAVLGDDDTPAEQQLYLDSLSAGCEPLNLFGRALSPEGIAYAFPSIVEGTTITQNALSLSFSGTAWDGLDAGPLQMAAGIDWNTQETVNFSGENPINSRDFYIQYGDAWSGKSTNAEAFVEFELPLLRDVPGADYLMVNFSDRRVQNESKRTSGEPVTYTRYTSSWKASMVWQPVEIMNVRLTRSSDQRAPSPRELYETSSPATAFTNVSEITNPFRYDDPDTAIDEAEDATRTNANGGASPGGNTSLETEISLTQTLGVVFTPGGSLDGLRASIDYIETTVRNGIEEVSWMQVPGRCAFQVQNNFPVEERTYCAQIEFGEPDPTQTQTPYPEYTNIEEVNGSRENIAPFWNRSIDYSISYLTQLGGGGSLNARLIATRYLEQSVDLQGFFGRWDVSGQTGSSTLAGAFVFPGQGSGFGLNYTPTPRIAGNLWLTYQKNALSVTSQVRYIGSGRLNKQDNWIGEGEVGHYRDPATGADIYVPYASNRLDTINIPDTPSFATMNLNFRYDFGLSPTALDRFNNVAAFLNITNVADRIPNFFSGTGAGGINNVFYSGLGRQYRLGVELTF